MDVPVDISLNMRDRAVFNDLFRAYYAPLCFFAGRIIENPDDAGDIVEDLFVKLWDRQQTFTDTLHAQSFFYRSIRNACLNYIKHGRVVRITHEMLLHTTEVIEHDHMSDMIRAEVWGELYRAIENLPLQCKKVISMSFLEGMTTDEIAAKLDLSPQTVRNTKMRGLRALKDSLPEHLLSLLIFYSFLGK